MTNIILAGRSLLLISIGVWAGAFVFFAAGSAPEVFEFASNWQLRGLHPESTSIVDSPRIISGYLTSGMVEKLNLIGTFCFLTGAFGLFLSWLPKNSRSMYLMTKTIVFLFIGVLHYVSVFVISDEMFRILQSGLQDFSATNPTRDVLDFRYLHGWYSRLAVLELISGVSLMILITWRPFQHFGTSLK